MCKLTAARIRFDIRAPVVNWFTFQYVYIIKCISLWWLVIPAYTAMRTRYIIFLVFFKFVFSFLGYLAGLCSPHNIYLLIRYYVLIYINLVHAFLSRVLRGNYTS